MAERKNTHGLVLTKRDDGTVIDIGEMEIWDGADLSLIRDTLARLIVDHRRRAIGIQMGTVKYVPSGFFGMLYDWYEEGITVRLYSPQPRVKNMLWFRRFFEQEDEQTYLLCPGDDAAFPLEEEEAENWDLDACSTQLSSARY